MLNTIRNHGLCASEREADVNYDTGLGYKAASDAGSLTADICSYILAQY